MNIRESTVAVMNYRKYDHLPVMHFGYWEELINKWEEEGRFSPEQRKEWGYGTEYELSKLLGFDIGGCEGIGGYNGGLYPDFEVETVKEFPDGSKHVRMQDGVVQLIVPGAKTVSAEIEHLLVDRNSWEKHYKWRLEWTYERLHNAILTPESVANINSQTGRAVGLHAGSVIGSIRNILGVEGLSYMQADDPDLLEEIITAFCDISYRCVSEILKAGIKPDFGHYWEDICFNHGPLVSPDFFRRVALPHYKRMTDLLYSHGVQWVSVDCDGKIDELIPIWLEGGVNTMFPIEIGTWNADFSKWRKMYGTNLLGIGGMNKLALSKDREAVDAEIERLKPWIDLGGFIPCPDHRLPPETKWDLVKYYTDKFRKTFA